MSAERNFTEQDYELLSAYIDDALAQSERAALESRLRTDARLQRELDSLRQTVQLINQLPTLRAPRDFTLDESMVGLSATRNTIRIFPAAFSALSAAAAVILFMFGGYFLLRQASPPMMTSNAGIIAAAPTISRATTFTFSATSTVSIEAYAGEAGADVQPLDADGNAMRSVITPDETQAKLDEDSANTTAADAVPAPAQVTAAPAATNLPAAEEAEISTFSEMAPEVLPTHTALPATGGMGAGDSLEMETFSAEPMEEAEAVQDESMTQAATSDLMAQNVPQMSALAEITLTAPAIAQAPKPQTPIGAITALPAEPDERLLGVVLLAAGAVSLGLAVITLLYRRRMQP